MTFLDLHQRLVANLRLRVRSGEFTERGLARLTRVSQPHIHHVLREEKLLSLNMADQIMFHLRMDVVDLIEHADLLRWQRPN